MAAALRNIVLASLAAFALAATFEGTRIAWRAILATGTTAQIRTFDMSADALASAFNAKAQAAHVVERMALEECKAAQRWVCNYRLADGLSALAGTSSGAGRITDVYLFWSVSPTTSDSFVRAADILVSLFSSDATSDERQVALNALTARANETEVWNGKMTLHGVKYQLCWSDLVVVFTVASLRSCEDLRKT